jgi:hypothetical protein
MFTDLIELLTCGSLDAIEQDEIEQRVANAPSNPEYEWTTDEAQAMSIELVFSLSDYVACGDKLDEVHEQLQELLEKPPPDFPYQLGSSIAGKFPSSLEYFTWLDLELSQIVTNQGSYDLVQLDTMVDDNMNLLVVYRRDIDRIIEIATKLQLRISRPLDYWHRIQDMISSLETNASDNDISKNS